jgi:hypothetical protein
MASSLSLSCLFSLFQLATLANNIGKEEDSKEFKIPKDEPDNGSPSLLLAFSQSQVSEYNRQQCHNEEEYPGQTPDGGVGIQKEEDNSDDPGKDAQHKADAAMRRSGNVVKK